MAESAMLLRRQGCRYDCHVSRWGGSDDAVAAVTDGLDPTSLTGVDWRSVGTWSFPTVVERIDYLRLDALYRAQGKRTETFLPLWFGLPLPEETATRTVGALVAVRSLPDARAVRTWFRQLKGALVDAHRDESLPALAIPLVLRRAVWKLTDRERYVSSGRAPETLSGNGEPDRP